MKPEHINDVRFDLDVMVRYHDRRRAYFDTLHRFIAGITVFGGSAFASDSGLTAYSFSYSAPSQKLIRNLTREAENAVRAELGHPPVRQAKRG